MSESPRVWYYGLADSLGESAPSQARLLRYFLLQDELHDFQEIVRDLGISESVFRVLINKLRERGVEVVCTRTHAPGEPNKDVRYLYGIRTTEVEGWSATRRKAVLTAWHRTVKVFERHLIGLGLEEREIGRYQGLMEASTRSIENVTLDIARKAEEQIAAKAIAENELAEA